MAPWPVRVRASFFFLVLFTSRTPELNVFGPGPPCLNILLQGSPPPEAKLGLNGYAFKELAQTKPFRKPTHSHLTIQKQHI